MSASGPYGKWTMADLAEELNIGLPWLRQSLLDKGCPKLAPDLTAGRLNLYGDDTAERWLAAYRKWREEEPARKAAKRADDDARARSARETEMGRIAVEQRVAAEIQAATDAGIAEEAARQAQALKGIY
jgi:predicted DNA repair protein MutK